MTRRIQVEDKNWGAYHFFVILEDEEGLWEEPWQQFRTFEETSKIADLFSNVTHDVYHEALLKAPLRLIRVLGMEPQYCLLKTPPLLRLCARRKTCLSHDAKKCYAGSPLKAPLCFEGDLLEDTVMQDCLEQILRVWEDGAYVIVVSKG